MNIPIVNIAALVEGTEDRHKVADQIGQACRDCGFFYVIEHGVNQDLQRSLEEASRQFFAQDLEVKLEIRMSLGGRGWRGYFPIGGELTSGKPDLKEGIYFGAELGDDDPRVRSDIPLHGPNLFPRNIPQLRAAVLQYMTAMTSLGHSLMAGISLSLGLGESYFADQCTSEPLILFRIFNYPPSTAVEPDTGFGVGEHTDYGLLTMLRQDETGGLQIKIRSDWIDADPIPNSFVCNVGDMLDRITGGRYLSAPHRVRNLAARHRLSFPFFFDPNFNAEVRPIRMGGEVHDNVDDRWDHASVHEFRGTYGDYLLGKVSKVFPGLGRDVF